MPTLIYNLFCGLISSDECWYIEFIYLHPTCLSQSVSKSLSHPLVLYCTVTDNGLSIRSLSLLSLTCLLICFSQKSLFVNCHSQQGLTIFHLFLVTGSGPSAEEHDRVSGRCQHPIPGHPGHARRVFTKRGSGRVTARCGRWT